MNSLANLINLFPDNKFEFIVLFLVIIQNFNIQQPRNIHENLNFILVQLIIFEHCIRNFFIYQRIKLIKQKISKLASDKNIKSEQRLVMNDEVLLTQTKIQIMEGQQRSDENNLYLKLDEQQLQMKYNEFYAELEIVQSQHASSDFDNLQLKLNQRIHENHYDIYCQLEHDLDHIRRNPRVADIPTVYLGTCIKTEHLPQRRFSILDEKEQQSKSNNTQRIDSLFKMEGKLRIQKQNQSQIELPSDSFENQNKLQKQLFNKFQNQKKRSTISILRQDAGHYDKIKFLPSQVKWKTDYITIKREQFLNIQNKQRKKMYQQWRVSNINSKEPKNMNDGNMFEIQQNDPLLYKRIIQIIENNEKLCKIAKKSSSNKINQLNLESVSNKSISANNLKGYKLEDNLSIKKAKENNKSLLSQSCKFSVDSRKRYRIVRKQNCLEDDELKQCNKLRYKYSCINHMLQHESNRVLNISKQEINQLKKRKQNISFPQSSDMFDQAYRNDNIQQ